MILWLLAVAALAACLAAAVLLSRRFPHRPAVLMFAGGLGIDLVVGTHDKATGAGWGLAQLLAHRPWSPTDRALYHVSNALVSAWPVAVAALAWWVLVPAQRRRAPPLLGALWALANVLLVAGPLDAARVQRGLLVVETGAVVAGFVAGAVGFAGPAWRAPQMTAAGLVGLELVVLLAGPFRYSVYERWDLAQICYMFGFAALALVQVLGWRRLRPSQAGPP